TVSSWLFLFQPVKKLPGGEDGNAGVPFKPEQMAVAADDVIGPARDSVFEDAVIIGIVRHRVEDNCWIDQIASACEFGSDRGRVWCRHAEFDAELVLKFIQQSRRVHQ